MMVKEAQGQSRCNVILDIPDECRFPSFASFECTTTSPPRTKCNPDICARFCKIRTGNKGIGTCHQSFDKKKLCRCDFPCKSP